MSKRVPFGFAATVIVAICFDVLLLVAVAVDLVSYGEVMLPGHPTEPAQTSSVVIMIAGFTANLRIAAGLAVSLIKEWSND